MHDQRTGGPHEQPQENVPSVAPSDVVSVQPNETAASEVDDASDPLAALTPVSPSDPVCSSDSETLASSLQDKLGSQIDALYNPA